MRYLAIALCIFMCIGIAAATNNTTTKCDRMWLIEKVLEKPPGEEILRIQAAEKNIICMTPPQSHIELGAAVNTSDYDTFETIEQLATSMSENNWAEDMLLVWYKKSNGENGSTILTVSSNRHKKWEVDNVNLPTRVSGCKKRIECDGGYDPDTGQIEVLDTVLPIRVEMFKAAA